MDGFSVHSLGGGVTRERELIGAWAVADELAVLGLPADTFVEQGAPESQRLVCSRLRGGRAPKARSRKGDCPRALTRGGQLLGAQRGGGGSVGRGGLAGSVGYGGQGLLGEQQAQ